MLRGFDAAMRTTADLDADMLAAARALADHEHISVGRAVNVLARRGLRAAAPTATAASGFPTFTPAAGHTITDELVAAHRDDA
ncbi:antitoxin [Cellulomonas sp. HZM]|uniref:antitoxin n=1 Tax=Cellulomonas sp. HZM TaxID=1454010 RepID=UPI0018CC2490|nr:antitoxin [Cellulomonas sp. HZM]